MNIAWDAGSYRDNFSFVSEYGKAVVDLVSPGEGLALDLGSGTGALSGSLREKGYEVIGIDDSEEMVRLARSSYPDINFMKADALSFSLWKKADVIFSNAVFHWIDGKDQERLISNISANLRPGGELVAEFGGKGCAEAVHSSLERAFERRGLSYPRVFYFPSIGEYAPILERHGLEVRYAVLFDRPTPQKPGRSVKDWVRMFVKKPFEGLPEGLTEEIINEAEEDLRPRLLLPDGTWFIDYVRIRLKAIKQA